MSKEVRHFILESVDFGKFDVVEYKEYQKLEKEIERLNNIIDELEKHIEENWNAIEKEPDNSFYDGYDTCIEEMKKDILDKLKELKEIK